MRTPRAILPLAVAAGLAAAASPANASDAPVARAAGGDAPAVVPSLIQTRITRAENALERLTQYVDDSQPDKVVSVGKVIRRQTAAAWRGAKYYLRTAPPPVVGDGLRARTSGKRKLKGGAVGPVVADQYQSAGAVFGLVHDVAAAAVELTDGAHGNTLAGLSRSLFWSLDKRDVMVQDAHALDAPPVPPGDGFRRRATRRMMGGAGSRRLMDGPPPSFAGVTPVVTMGLDDELQQIDGLRSDATDLSARGKSILRQAETQIVFTERTINNIWPPLPPGDG